MRLSPTKWPETNLGKGTDRRDKARAEVRLSGLSVGILVQDTRRKVSAGFMGNPDSCTSDRPDGYETTSYGLDLHNVHSV